MSVYGYPTDHIFSGGLRTYPYPENVPDFRIYLIALQSEGVIIPQKIDAYYFSGCTWKQFF
jgi:hypothetical protein